MLTLGKNFKTALRDAGQASSIRYSQSYSKSICFANSTKPS